MATPNYAFEKRKKELAKKQKKQQKQEQKLATQDDRSREDAPQPETDKTPDSKI
jgi:hypothetical protein